MEIICRCIIYRFFMQKIITEQEQIKSSIINDLQPEEKQKLVGVFAWLIQEDKKQNPHLYQPKKENEND